MTALGLALFTTSSPATGHPVPRVMWELFWQSSHVAADRAGPRLIGSDLPTQGRQLMQHAMTGTARPGPRADAEAMAPPSGRWLGLE
jgi:hypothetical protein